MPPPGRAVTVALIDDYDIVVVGVAHMFDRYADRIEVVELDATTKLASPVDVALYDAFAQPDPNHRDFVRLVAGARAAAVAVYTWNFHPRLIDDALRNGAAGYLSKALPARRLVEAIEAIHAGEVVVSDAPRSGRLTVGLDWPGRSEGLSEREAEVLALIVQGKSNHEISDQVCLSINSIKTYIRSAYRKIGVTNRVEAVLWGIDHGFSPDHHRIEAWFAEPMADVDAGVLDVPR
jgi:DNA-binding NarL/FixJ family response regulator